MTPLSSKKAIKWWIGLNFDTLFTIDESQIFRKGSRIQRSPIIALNNIFYLFGGDIGQDNESVSSNIIAAFSPFTKKWKKCGVINQARHGHRVFINQEQRLAPESALKLTQLVKKNVTSPHSFKKNYLSFFPCDCYNNFQCFRSQNISLYTGRIETKIVI